MITCKECGCTYDERRATCPKCGNPTKNSIIVTDKATCPCCGAEGEKVQGYNFVCEFCGTLFPVDARTRATIDAQRQQVIMAQQQVINEEVKKKNNKTLKIIFGIIILLISIPIGINYYSSYEQKQKMDETEREKAEAKATIKKTIQAVMQGNTHSVYISPRDIFIANNQSRIGHLNQNLISILKQKGYIEDGVLTYSYYINKNFKESNENFQSYDYDPSIPLIKIVLNSYNPIISISERKNETDAVHSVTIIIYNKELSKAYENSFKKGLRNIGFVGEIDDRYSYNSSSEMSNFGLIRIGNTLNKTEYFIKEITANWEGVKFGKGYGYISDYDYDYDNEFTIECVGFCELNPNQAKAQNSVKTLQKTTQASNSYYSTEEKAKDAVEEAQMASKEAVNAALKAIEEAANR